jgi:hypothetical protein
MKGMGNMKTGWLNERCGRVAQRREGSRLLLSDRAAILQGGFPPAFVQAMPLDVHQDNERQIALIC